MGFNLGNALKYIWRCDLKKDAIEDLKKARWYIDRELAKRGAKEMGYKACRSQDEQGVVYMICMTDMLDELIEVQQ